jgi:hypothetical protein
MTLDPWQEYVLSALMETDALGNWASSEFGLLVSRQNGKGEILTGYDLTHLFLFPRTDNRRKTILHSAHEVKTAIDAFERLQGIIESVPRLMSRVERIYTANGKEGILLKRRPGQLQGDRIRFIARTKKSGRGFAADILVSDEAQELSLQANNALAYTQSQIDNPQVVYTGTVPEEGVNESEVWEGLRDRGRKGKGEHTGWMEWTPERSEDPDTADSIDPGDRAAWIAANPSLGWRMPLSNIEDQYERSTTDPDGFLRERLSVWPDRRPEQVKHLSDLDIQRWRDNAIPDAKLGETAVIALALGRGGGFATVAAASRFDDESIFVEHERTERGTVWVAKYLKALKERLNDALIVLDPKNAAPVLVDLQLLDIKYLPMNMDEIAAAHSGFIEGSNNGMIVHRGQEEVSKSLEYATTRPIGRAGFTWDPSDPSKPISQAQAVTWAAWGLRKFEALPPKSKPIVRGYA